MAFLHFLYLHKFLFLLFLFLSSAHISSGQHPAQEIVTFGLKRSDFPKDFLFGAASSSYQYEGAAFIDGKGPSIWDIFTHNFSNKIADHSNGDVAEDFYHRYKEDIKLMKFIGLDSFRFSISWPRLIPTGKLSDGVNQKGIDFYNNLINELLANGIKPLVTLFHWDLPQHLEDAYNGFLSPQITNDFMDFADLCFKEFGDRVKLWSTINEPNIFTFLAYDLGILAPGRCSAWRNNDCPAGNSATEPYIVAHNILIAHASPSQKGTIGIVIATQAYEPFSNSNADIEAVQRAQDFFYGWFADPLAFGHYPQSMQDLVGNRLPKFTSAQSDLVKGSFDFFGLNYYSANFAANTTRNVGTNISYSTDNNVLTSTIRNGKPIGEQEGNSMFFVYPKGLQDVLVYTKNRYNNPLVYITENGFVETGVNSVQVGVMDNQRINFYREHLKYLKKSIDLGVNVKGFYPWSFLDTFEWNSGYTLRFGLVYIDYQNGLKRYPKFSALSYKKFLSS
ncbi:OLC1v1001641C1 [Oldenlandia corymbosa var. corymbosa]|uniref:OLC1v1001641C1 n=1 Tax=Oldenlandia corymbosa var. corymbosa TaxID=529605 RepID=A0AAV1D5S0_OLDCO|nr:OLC1v1001641C1 [Oldenlandia corymbosa var. corymbosa]